MTMGRGVAPVASTAAAVVLLASGCSADLAMPDPATEQGGEALFLWRVTFWVALVLGALVLGLLVVTLVRDRDRDPGDDRLPPQHRGHVPLELAYTAVPVAIVAVLFVLSWRADSRTTALADEPGVVVEVTAFQWQWQFEYPDHDVVLTGERGEELELVLPRGREVRLRLRSADVIHSFFVPGFLMKRDAIPGVVTEVDVTPTRLGRYGGHCAEFCGLDHAAMDFAVRVVPPAAFESWLEDRRAAR